MIAYVGVDWSATKVVVAAAAEQGDPRGVRTATPSLSDLTALVQEVRSQFGAQEVRVFVEKGADTWIRLFAAAGATVFAVDPKQAKRFGESLGSSGAKDDRRDAITLVELGRSARHRLEAWKAPDELVERLTRLSSRRERLVEDRTRELQRLREDLARTMPLVEATIKTFESKWVLNLLRAAPTGWHAGRLSAERLLELMAGAKPATIDRLKDALSKTSAPWMTRAVAEDEARAVHQALSRIALFDKHIAAADALTEQLLDEVPLAGRLDAVPGIGQQLATALIVFGLLGTGDRDTAAVRMGAAPVFRGSGTRADGRPKGAALMRKAAPPRARQMSYLLGRLASMHLGWAKAQYAAARERGKTAATAYRQVARSLLRILHAMARDGTEYDDARYEAALAAQGVGRG